MRSRHADSVQDIRECLGASAQLRETVFHESIANDQAQGNGSPAGDPTAQGRPDLADGRRVCARGFNAISAHDWISLSAKRGDAMSGGTASPQESATVPS